MARRLTIAASDLREIANLLCDKLVRLFAFDITSIDNFGEEPRFEILSPLLARCSSAIETESFEDVGAVDTAKDLVMNRHEFEIYVDGN